MERSNFPHRNLDEDDEELLNGIWAGLETPDDRPGADSRDFDDVKRRIRRRVRRRWMSRATLAGSAAAIVAAVVLVVRQPGVLPEPDAFAQLQQMGVTVERPQVVMTADDGMRLVLENAARLERRSEGEVALRTETGEQRPLATERKLKVEVPNGRQFRLVLEPNQQVSRDLAAGTVAVSAVDASVYGAWKEGWLWFENESLPALAERLGRIYGIRVEVAARLGEYTFSGKIRQDRGVEYILNLLSETSDVICKVENGVMRLS